MLTEILVLSPFYQHQHILIAIVHIHVLFKSLDLTGGNTPLHCGIFYIFKYFSCCFILFAYIKLAFYPWIWPHVWPKPIGVYCIYKLFLRMYQCTFFCAIVVCAFDWCRDQESYKPISHLSTYRFLQCYGISERFC